MQKFKKMLAMLLCLTMILSSMPMTTFADTPKATFEAVIIKEDAGETLGYKAMTQTEIEALGKNDTFLVGILMKDIKNLPGINSLWDTSDDSYGYGLFQVVTNIEYNSKYLQCEPNALNASGSFVENTAKPLVDARLKKYSDTYMNSGDGYSCSGYGNARASTDDWKTAVVMCTSNTDSAPWKGGTIDQYAAIMEFKILDDPTAAITGLRMYTGSYKDEVNSISFGEMGEGGHFQYNGADDEYSMETFCDFTNNANLGYLFPTPVVLPAIDGTAKISVNSADITTSNIPKYGDTLTAVTTAITDGTSALPSGTKYSYQWYRGSDKIDGATNSTYTLGKDDFGKVINVGISSDKTKGELKSTYTDSVKVGQRGLKFCIVGGKESSVTVKSVKVGATGTALTVSGDYQFVANDRVVGSDVVKTTYTATYTDASAAAATVDFNNVSLSATLTGADAQYYTFDAITNAKGVGSVVAREINKIAVTTDPTKMTYNAGESLDLTDMVVKIYYTDDMANPETLSASDYTVAVNGTAVTDGTTAATAAMNGKAYTVTLTADSTKTADTTGTLTVNAAAMTAIAANSKAGAPANWTYAYGAKLTDKTDFLVTVNFSDGTTADYTWADLKDAGFTFAIDGATVDIATLTLDPATHDGKDLTITKSTLSGNKTMTATLTVGKVAPTVTFGNTSQTFGSAYTAVTAVIKNVSGASEVDLGAKVQYEVPAYTEAGTAGTACTKTVNVACNHTAGNPGCAADCTYVAGTACTETVDVPCEHTGTYKATTCTYAAAVPCTETLTDGVTACNHIAGDPGCAATCTYVAEVPCTETYTGAPCDHGTHKAATCTYVAGTPCTKTVSTPCNHTTGDPGCAADCTYVAASAGASHAAQWVNSMTDSAMTAYLATLTSADCPVTINVKVPQTDFAGNTYYDALAADATATLTLTAPSTGGGGGGGGASSSYTVKFDNGKFGTFAKDAKTSVKVDKGEKLASSDIPSVTAKDGYKFLGWSLDGKTVVDPTANAVTKAVTYTALYKEVSGSHAAYMNGNEKGLFLPDANITRAEAAALLGRLVPAYNEDTKYTGNFSDVAATAWYANEVFFDVENGYITGYTDGTFKPLNNITRQEFAIIVARYLGMENEGTSSFADCKGVYAEGYISQLVSEGIIGGYEDGTFRPNADITRAEATKILNAVFDRVPDKAVIDEAVDNYDVSLSDVSKRHWAYYEILEAAIDHEIDDFHA